MKTPSVEFFPVEPEEIESEWTPGEYLEPGWYYWYCEPGCLPNSEPIGPFASETLALEAFENETAELAAQ